jgi:hypothetical protein
MHPAAAAAVAKMSTCATDPSRALSRRIAAGPLDEERRVDAPSKKDIFQPR